MSGSNQHGENETSLLVRLWIAQKGRCFCCDEIMLRGEEQQLDRGLGWSREHVYPKGSTGFGLINNVVLTHPRCNGEKGDREPTPDEIARARAIYMTMGLTAFIAIGEGETWSAYSATGVGRIRHRPAGFAQRALVGHTVKIGDFASLGDVWPK